MPGLTLNGVAIRTEPVKYSAGPFADGCEPLRLMSIERLAPVSEPPASEQTKCSLFKRGAVYIVARSIDDVQKAGP